MIISENDAIVPFDDIYKKCKREKLNHYVNTTCHGDLFMDYDNKNHLEIHQKVFNIFDNQV